MRRDERLPRGPFDRAFKKGIVIHGPFLVVRALQTGAGRARWGFAVGKRLEKRAVRRNQVRRRLRSAAEGLGAADGWHLVVVARQPSLGATVPELRAQLQRALRRVR